MDHLFLGRRDLVDHEECCTVDTNIVMQVSSSAF